MQLYQVTLETYLFKRNLELHQAKSNNIDIHLARELLETVESISNFLATAQIQDTDDRFNLDLMKPSFESDMCQGHRNFYCKPCNRSVKATSQSFMEHYSSASHLKHLTKLERTVEHERKSISNSESDKREQRDEKPKEEPTKKEQRKEERKQRKQSIYSFGSAKKLRMFLKNVDIETYIGNLEKEGEMIRQSNVHVHVCTMLLSHLRPFFPKAGAYPFGSIVNGLARNGGDLDIYIDLGDCYVKKPPRRLMSQAIFHTKNALTAQSKDWSGFCPITKARTPILKAFCKSLRIQCDFSFSNGLSHRNTLLIGFMMELQPITRRIVLFVKAWITEFDLGMNSYIITMLVIFYLQQKGSLPSVVRLQKKEFGWIDGWLVSFDRVTLEELQIEKDNTPIVDHLIGFFDFYGSKFDFKNLIISILAGHPIAKEIFDHGREHEIPAIFDRFKEYMKVVNLEDADEVDDLFANRKPLVVQDPFELCHNVGKGIREKGLKRIVDSMKLTHEILREFVKSKAEQ